MSPLDAAARATFVHHHDQQTILVLSLHLGAAQRLRTISSVTATLPHKHIWSVFFFYIRLTLYGYSHLIARIVALCWTWWLRQHPPFCSGHRTGGLSPLADHGKLTITIVSNVGTGRCRQPPLNRSRPLAGVRQQPYFPARWPTFSTTRALPSMKVTFALAWTIIIVLEAQHGHISKAFSHLVHV
jgi:hypothetical protein